MHSGPGIQSCSTGQCLFVPLLQGRYLNIIHVGQIYTVMASIVCLWVYVTYVSFAFFCCSIRMTCVAHITIPQSYCYGLGLAFILRIAIPLRYFYGLGLGFILHIDIPLRYCVPLSLPCFIPCVGSCDCQNCRRMSAKLITLGSQATWTTWR